MCVRVCVCVCVEMHACARFYVVYLSTTQYNAVLTTLILYGSFGCMFYSLCKCAICLWVSLYLTKCYAMLLNVLEEQTRVPTGALVKEP